MAFTFPAEVAYDPGSNKPVKNASFQVYAPTDTAFLTPLAITDAFGTPLPGNILNSGSQGVFPEFQQATNSTVTIADSTKTYAWTLNCVQQDQATASFINTPGSATATALNATYALLGGTQEISKQLSTSSSNASANIAAINAAITAANTAGGGVVAITVPGTYVINDHILMRANVTLRVGVGVTIKKAASATGNVCMLRNANMSTTAPYTDTNMVLEGGGTFDGNYANNSTMVAQADQTAATTNTLAYGVQGDTCFIGVQNLIIRGVNFINCNGFAVQILGQDILVDHVTLSTGRDGIHVNGPSKHVIIRDVYGTSNDDFIALNAWDWHRSGPAVGDITDVTIDRCTYLGDSGVRPGNIGRAVKILPGTRASGAGAGTGNVRDVTIRDLHVEGAPGVVVLSDFDAFNGSEYSGAGIAENISWIGGYVAPDATNNTGMQIYKGGGGTPADGQTSLTVRNFAVQNVQFNLAANSAANAAAISYIYTGLSISGLVFRDCSWTPKAAGGCQFLNVQSKSALDSIEIDGMTWLAQGQGGGFDYPAITVNLYNGSAASEIKHLALHRLMTAPGITIDSPIVSLLGIVDWMTGRDWDITCSGGSGDNHGIYFSSSVAALKGFVLSNLNLTNPKELFRIGAGATGSVICKGLVRDVNLVGCTHPVFISGSRQADIAFRGGNIDTPNNIARVDTSTLTLTLDGTTSTGAGATTITQVSTTTLRVPRADRISLPLNTLTLTPSDGDWVYSSATPTTVVSGTGAGQYIYRGSAGWVKLN